VTTASDETVTTDRPGGRQAATRAAVPTGTATVDRSGRQQAGVETADRAGPKRPVAHALVAAERAVRRNSLHLQLPIVGELQLPAAEQVAFIGGVAALAVVGVLEWPVAALLGLGHGLATIRHNKLLRAFGEALEEA
jgi:hypothetical protein